MHSLDYSKSAEVTLCEQGNRVSYLIFFFTVIFTLLPQSKNQTFQDKTAVDSQKIESNESKDTR